MALTRKMKIDVEELKALAVTMARDDFYTFCRFRVPSFYLPHRTYLKDLCNQLQAFMEDKLIRKDGTPYDKLMTLGPPRHGKTLTIILLCQWVLGKSVDTGIITASYNETLSSRLAKAVRNGILEIKADPMKLVYSDFFPETKIQDGDGAMNMWSLEGRHFSFLATSPGGTMTGVGGKLFVLDDLIKNFEEACNERILEEHMMWYDNTTQSRLEFGAKQILINTRWATRDISGQLLTREPDEWYVILNKACLDEEKGIMLAPDILDFKTYMKRKRGGDEQLIAANYQQEPYDSSEALYRFTEGNLYRPYELPRFGRRMAYIDTADQGMDFLSGGCWLEHDGKAYILDLIYTQEAMERTEPDTAAMLQRNRVERAYIESNNGGRGFARNVQALLVKNGFTSCGVEWFHQGANKWSRITANANSVVNCVVFPHDWRDRWPLFALHVERASRASQPKPDDAHDFLTGVVETLQGSAALIITEQDRASLASRWRK